MRYRFDIIKFAVQLVPPVLRNRTVAALLRVMTLPLRYMYEQFVLHRGTVERRINTTAAVQYIEKALNEAFFLKDRQIYIISGSDGGFVFWHLKKEARDGIYMDFESGDALVMRHDGEGVYDMSFTVYVPTFLCTSLVADDDEFGGENLRKIRNMLDLYKPAGKTYGIQLYDYYEETEIQ